MSLEGLPRHTRTVGLSELVERVVHASYTDLRRLATNLPGQPEADRKRELARYLHNLRQRLTRLHVLAEWAPKNRGAQIAVKCGDMMGQLRQHQMAFTDAADRLYGLRQQMDWAAGPLYDTPGALDVLCNGKYSNLPKAIADVAPKPVPLETDPELIELRDERCRRFDVEIRGLLVDERNRKTMPKAMRVFSVRDGECVVGVPGEYRATLTLGGPPPLPPPPEEDEDGAENEPNPKKDSDPAPPPSRLGGWLVVKIEMLAGEMMDADEEEGRVAHTRVFPLTKTEVKILGERATARMAGMSPPPPAPPELVEGGAQGLGGLHYVCHDIALRLCALTVMNQSKKVARGGGAWHGGAIRTEQIMGKAEARAGIDEDAGEPGETEDVEQEHKKPARGAGEGIRMWFWLPGLAAGEGLKASTGNRMAGVDVGSVEVGVGNAAAVDAAVAAGTLPRVELTYERADDKDSSSGAIAARALIPTDRAGVVEIETFDLPFSTASVDIKEVLADGVRAAAATRLRAALTDLEPACQAAGIDVPTLALDAVNTGDANEDGWMATRRPAITLRLTREGTSAQVTCGKRGGELCVCGVGSFASSGAAERVEHSVSVGGIPALLKALPTLRRRATEWDLREALGSAGVHTHPAPHSMKGWVDDVAPAALALVPPASGNLFVALYVSEAAGEQTGGTSALKKSPKKGAKKGAGGAVNAGSGALVARLALVSASRRHPASAPAVAAVAPLATDGVTLLDAKKRKSGEIGVFPFDVKSAVEGIANAVRGQKVTAQRSCVTSWCKSRGLRFTDARFNDGSHPIVAFSAKLGDDEWGETQTVCATCEVELKGAEGVRLTVRCPSLHPDAKATDPKQREGASVASRGGVASIDVEADGWRVGVDYPDSEFAAGAACGDAHRAVAMLALVKRFNDAKDGECPPVALTLEPLSVVVETPGGFGSRVSWVGGTEDGGLAAAGVNGGSVPSWEEAASEAARVGDPVAFVNAFVGDST